MYHKDTNKYHKDTNALIRENLWKSVESVRTVAKKISNIVVTTKRYQFVNLNLFQILFFI